MKTLILSAILILVVPNFIPERTVIVDNYKSNYILRGNLPLNGT